MLENVTQARQQHVAQTLQLFGMWFDKLRFAVAVGAPELIEAP